MMEVDAMEDLVKFVKIKRLGGTVPQLTKIEYRLLALIYLIY